MADESSVQPRLARPPPHAAPPVNGTRRAEDRRRLRILLVEQDEAHALLLRSLLASEARPGELEPAVVHAASPEDALGVLHADAFDLVLLDLDPGGSGGLATVDALQPCLGDAALVVLGSLRGDDEAVLLALRRGASDYLADRGLNPVGLRRALRHAAERRVASGEHRALRQLQATLDSLGSHIAVLDRAGRIVFVNAAWRAFAALNGNPDPAAGVGTSYVQVRDGATGAEQAMAREVAGAIRDVSEGRRDSWHGEYACHSPTGQRYFSMDMVACPDPTLAVVIHHEDITERRKLEEALRSSNERFALVQLATNDVIWDWDLSRPAAEADSDIEGWEERVHPRDRARIRAGLDDALSQADAWTAEYRYRRGDGSYATVYDRRYVLRGEDGRAVRLIGSMQDVTEQHRLTMALAHSEAHYRRLVERAPQTIYALDRHGRFTEINPAGIDLLRRTADELVGSSFAEIVDPEDVAVASNLFRDIRGGAAAVETVLRIRRPSGEARWVQIHAAGILSGSVVVGTHGMARDITDDRERESRMRLFAAALENLTESVNVLDAGGRIVYANVAHARMLGYDAALPPHDGIAAFAADPESREALRRAQARVGEEGVWRGRLDMRRMDGHTIPVEMHMERVAQDGRSLVFAISRDVSAELEQDHRLRRAERLASMGTLVGGVAHELNNPLAAVLGFAQLMLMNEHTAQDREDLETIRREAQRMAAIVTDLRLLARDSHEAVTARDHVDLNDVVRHVLRTRGYSLLTHNIKVAEELDPGLPAVLGDRGQLEQVVLNLVVNAEQAMGAAHGSGVLGLRTRRSGSGLALHVSDNGPGIPPSHLERIFDPFFTTKAPGEGTGLGLSLVHNIVTEHHGQISVDSQAGSGTTFRIDLPGAAAPDAEPSETVPDASAAGPRALRVLVVDDEVAVRRVIARYLDRRGHRVEEARDGGQALELLAAAREEGELFDMIVSDLRMPGLSGTELLERLRRAGDGMDRRLVFLTGDTAGMAGEARDGTEAVPVLTKPVDLAALARFVEDLAD